MAHIFSTLQADLTNQKPLSSLHPIQDGGCRLLYQKGRPIISTFKSVTSRIFNITLNQKLSKRCIGRKPKNNGTVLSLNTLRVDPPDEYPS